jgi:hypothetical protein
VEAKILTKRAELSKFESEYREVCTDVLFYIFPSGSFFMYLALKCISLLLNTDVSQVLAKFNEMTSTYAQQMQTVYLLNQSLIHFLQCSHLCDFHRLTSL